MKRSSIRRYSTWSSSRPFICRTRNGTPRTSSSRTKRFLASQSSAAPGKGDKRVDLKEFRRQHALRALSFASAEDLLAVLGLIPGAVSPLGILNDIERRVHVYLDREFAGSKIGVHPNDNTATVWLQADDLLALLKQHGNEAVYTDL